MRSPIAVVLLAGSFLAGPLACHGPRPPGAATAASPAPGRDSGGDAQVQVTLLAEPAALAPGQTARLHARFLVAPGWHIYAADPGESGLPTRLRVTAPPGFTVGDTVYPPAETFTAPGPVRSFGYQGEAVLLTPVTAPAAAAPAPITLRARASWLACKDSCVPGSAELSLTLSPGAPAPHQ